MALDVWVGATNTEEHEDKRHVEHYHPYLEVR